MKLLKYKFIILFLILTFCFSNTVFGFTEEEQAEINNIVSTLIANSKNQTATWAMGLGGSGSGTKVAFFETDFIYNDIECKYLGVMYWNNQCSVTLTDGVLVGKNIDYSKHDLNIYYFDGEMNCLGAKSNNLSSGSSITINGVNSYFFSEFTIENSSGEVVQPFFQLAPPETEKATTLVEIMGQVTEQAQTEITPTILKVVAIVVGLVISLIALRTAFQVLVNGLKT